MSQEHLFWIRFVSIAFSFHRPKIFGSPTARRSENLSQLQCLFSEALQHYG